MTRRVAAVLILWLAFQAASSVQANQDALSKVRELYRAADYEGALAVLDRLDGPPRDNATDLADYRVLCLLALDRADEAREAIKSVVEADPLHQLSESQASPRMRTVFQETRKALLPDLVQRMYAEAKTSFDKHDPAAVHQFDRLMALLDAPDLKDAQLSDLRAVAAGFRDLSKAAANVERESSDLVRLKPDTTSENGNGKAETSEARRGTLETTSAPVLPRANITAVSAAARPLTGPPDKIRVSPRGATPLFTAKAPPAPGLEPPLVIAQTIPQWSWRGRAGQQSHTGIVEITIDEQGTVTRAAIQQPIQPAFDQALLKASRTWNTPARLNGTPVSFLKVIEIQIQPDH